MSCDRGGVTKMFEKPLAERSRLTELLHPGEKEPDSLKQRPGRDPKKACGKMKMQLPHLLRRMAVVILALNGTRLRISGRTNGNWTSRCPRR